MTNLDSIFKSRDITLPTKVHLVKAMVFPLVMYGCESWIVKKAERRRIDAFELWCWRRLLRVPWTARRSNQSILKEISPGELVMPSNHLILCRPLLLLPSNLSQHQGLFKCQFLASGGQSIGVSVSASVLPMNTQDWSPSGWTGWISLQSKGLSRVFSKTTVQRYQFFGAQLSSQSNSHIHT